MKKIGILVGSLRKGSYSRKIAEAMSKKLDENFEVSFISIEDLPLYNEDLDEDGLVPKRWEELRKNIKEVDSFLFVTPEYNRGVTAVLKNALDVGSRPYGHNVWDGKPAGIISVSTGNIGGFGSNHHLRQSMTFLNVFPMQQPEAYLSNVIENFDENGNITVRTDEYLNSISNALTKWINRF